MEIMSVHVKIMKEIISVYVEIMMNVHVKIMI